MDIESKKWRMRSHNGPKRQLTNQETGETRIVNYARDAQHLAAITEKQFDEEMRRAFNEAKN
jgi:hypothetical protein